MKLGKVIGNVVATQKDPGLNSLRLLVIQGLDDKLQPQGTPYVAADGIETAGPGDIVYLVSKKEAAIVFEKELVPIDECIVGYVDEHFVTKSALKKLKKKQRVRKPRKEEPPKTLELVEPTVPEPIKPIEKIEPIKPIPKSKIPKQKISRTSKQRVRTKKPRKNTRQKIIMEEE